MGRLIGFRQCVVVLSLLISMEAKAIEEEFARIFYKDFSSNRVRLEEIAGELEALPRPYLREPTGTGGFLSQAQESATDEVVLRFGWAEAVTLDAAAFFPLRLFMNEIYSENLYWPGSITIEAEIDGHSKVVAGCNDRQSLVRQSLPELVEFEPVVTRELVIRCTDLPPHRNSHAAGFAEICLFSGAGNVAPRASYCRVSSSRQGYHVLAKEFLTDAQTPLGIPELSSRSIEHGFVKKLGWGRRPPKNPYILTLTWPRETPMDAVRIDPAIQHAYLQSFPVRFTIELLDAGGEVVYTDNTYKNFPLRTPGLNSFFSFFPEIHARSLRLTVLAASRPVPRANQAIAFSELTALYQGESLSRATVIEEVFMGKSLRIEQGDRLNTPGKQMLASASDGFTQGGRVLPLRRWIEGLGRRQRLLEEQMTLELIQEKMLVRSRRVILQGSLLLILLVSGGAVYYVMRNRIRLRKEIRATRVKIAGDLHDDVGSNLGAIILHVERLEEKIDSPPEPQRLRAIYRLTRESVFGLREVLSATAPEVGRTQNLVAYMDELAGLILGKTYYTFEVDRGMNEVPMTQGLRKDLLLFYKEALHNAKRHSGGTKIDISLRHSEGAIILTVKDNGKGIGKDKLNKNRTLRTLKQRAEWLHAELRILSQPGEGTEVSLLVKES
ncbi:MAG: histidine kinase [Verrucomicrobiales bacterium]|nr:histidine kinase [Verrucomicrobiales bacterium]